MCCEQGVRDRGEPRGTEGLPAAVILSQVGAVLPDLGPALRLEALHHRILLRCRFRYKLQQLLAPAHPRQHLSAKLVHSLSHVDMLPDSVTYVCRMRVMQCKEHLG
jgi:hypothetical protein